MAATEEQKAYLAGLIDGEGCIELAFNYRDTYPQYYPRITVHITNIDCLEFIKNLYGGNVVKRNMSKFPEWRQSYDYKISCQKAMVLLKDIEPYSIIKKDEVNLLLQFKLTTSPRSSGLSKEEIKKREFIHKELKNLKHKRKEVENE